VNALRRFERILESLKPENDYYCLNLDFDAYCHPSSCCSQRLTRGNRRYCKALAAVDTAYADSACWAKKSILNVARRCVLPHPRL
jgi:glucan phosphorylase